MDAEASRSQVTPPRRDPGRSRPPTRTHRRFRWDAAGSTAGNVTPQMCITVTVTTSCRTRPTRSAAGAVEGAAHRARMNGGPGHLQGLDTHEGSRLRRWSEATRLLLLRIPLTGGLPLRFFQPPADVRFYASADLHARSLFLRLALRSRAAEAVCALGAARPRPVGQERRPPEVAKPARRPMALAAAARTPEQRRPRNAKTPWPGNIFSLDSENPMRAGQPLGKRSAWVGLSARG